MTHLIGIIGGSGLYQMEGFHLKEEKRVATPFGEPSDAYMIGELNGTPLVFLPRHGRGHRISPTEINFRANIYGMKALGVSAIISVSAVGSLRAEITPGHFVIIDQFIDRTTQRSSTFFGEGIVAHVSLADPICPNLADQLYRSCQKVGITAHRGGTYICIEGPAFSTRAESHMYRAWGGSVIGMTNIQEAKLAREAEICYATVALSTDYDCWKEDEAHVDVAQVVATVKSNVANVQKVIREAISGFKEGDCPCPHALKGGIMTLPSAIPAKTAEKLGPIVKKYITL